MRQTIYKAKMRVFLVKKFCLADERKTKELERNLKKNKGQLKKNYRNLAQIKEK